MPSDKSTTGTDRSLAEKIVASCEHEPSENADGHPKLFDDLDDGRVSHALFGLWQRGIVDAEWDTEDGGTEWWLTKFGVELCERGLVRPYIEATQTESKVTPSPDMLVDPEEVR